MKLPFLVKPGFRIIAHRGASGYAPENTMASFQLAVDMGATEIELDVRLSADGEVVICHDASLERFGHQGTVENLSWAELSQMDMGSWFSPFLFSNEKMPRLEELFSKFGSKLTYHLEIKGTSEALPVHVLTLIDQYSLQGQVVLTSFSYDTLARARNLHSHLSLGWLVPGLELAVLEKAHDLDLLQLCPRAGMITRTEVERARSVVPEVRVWGLHGHREDILALIQMSIDADCDGLTIDWPDWLKHRF